jgi:hypothetical protein
LAEWGPRMGIVGKKMGNPKIGKKQGNAPIFVFETI